MKFDKDTINNILEFSEIYENAYDNTNGMDIICFSTLKDIILGKKVESDINKEIVDICINQIEQIKEFGIIVGLEDVTFFNKCVQFFYELR